MVMHGKSAIEQVPMLAGHPALDFLNTVVMVKGEPVDFFQHDADVLGWLKLARQPGGGFWPGPQSLSLDQKQCRSEVAEDCEVGSFLKRRPDRSGGLHDSDTASALVRTARSLREGFRVLLEKRKAGKQGDVSVLNGFLAAAQSYPQLVAGRSRPWSIDRVRPHGTPEQILAPVTESAAELLVYGNFELVKQCEDESCVLWFYDQTKSHHRRWCSMANCGNRNKVSAYRKRRTDADA